MCTVVFTLASTVYLKLQYRCGIGDKVPNSAQPAGNLHPPIYHHCAHDLALTGRSIMADIGVRLVNTYRCVKRGPQIIINSLINH